MILSPLDQFEIVSIVGGLTNMVAYIILIVLGITLSTSLISKGFGLIPDRWWVIRESFFSTIYEMVTGSVTSKQKELYVPGLYGLFFFILVANLVGMVPYSFAITSHFVLTFSISFAVVLGATIIGFYTHGLKFFSLLVPAGCPLGLLPLLVVIELISYLARNVSLGLRLAANVLSGHMLLNILSGFAFDMLKSGTILTIVSILPLAFVVAFSGLELAIAFIQAQVFAVLTCSYVKDGLDLH